MGIIFRFLLVLLICTTVSANELELDDHSDAVSRIASLVANTLDDNPRVKAARAAAEAAKARERASNQPLYNPQLALEAEDAIDQSASIGINQTIDWNDKRGARGKIGTFEHEAAVAELQNVRQSLAIELLNGLIQHDVATKLSSIASDRERLMREFAAIAVQRREAGDLNLVDLDLARLALSEAQIQRAQASFKTVAIWQTVVGIMGEAPGTLPVPPEQPPVLKVQKEAIDQLLQNLPAIKAQLARIASARSLIKLRRLEKRPDPTLGFRVGQEESDLLAGVTLSIPLFVRNPFQAEVDSASAELVQVEEEALDLYRRTHARMTTTRDRYQLVYAAWQNWTRTGLISLRNQTSLVGKLWRAGEISTTDYLVRLRQALDTEVAAMELYGDLWQAWFDWLAASGQIDNWLGLTSS